MRLIFILLFIFFADSSNAQNNKNYSKEFSFVNENDIYILQHKDGYYTNGFLLQFSKALLKNNHKIINRFSLGQNMYTVGNRQATYNGEQPFDRPYCGYLFFNFTHDIFFNDYSLISISTELGITGDLSLARQLQNWYHKAIDVTSASFWDKQIANNMGINAAIKYATTIQPQKAEKSYYKIVPTVAANIGTLFNNAQAGAYFCLGNFENNSNSVLFNATINKNNVATKYQYELFVYFFPKLTYQIFNTTVQGNIFKQETNPNIFTTDVMPFMYQQTLGVAYAKKRWSAKVEIIFQTKEAKSQINNHQYGGLYLAYKF